MEESLKFIFHNYSTAKTFRQYWLAFENYLDSYFPDENANDSFRKRLERFEKYLDQISIHHIFLRRIFNQAEANALAELKPRIFRERTGDTTAHEAFSSDYQAQPLVLFSLLICL